MPGDSKDEFRRQLAHADALAAKAGREVSAAADARARVIAAEVERRGRGGQTQVAAELGISVQAVSEAVRRAAGLTGPQHGLPADTLERLLHEELDDIAPLTRMQWEALASLIHGTVIDPSWIPAPGRLLAIELEDAELGPEFRPEEIIKAARSWTRVQALAVIDACQREDMGSLPTREA